MSASAAALILPMPLKYATVDGRYRFSKRSDAFTLLEDHPIADSLRIWHYRLRRVNKHERHIPASQMQLDATKEIYAANRIPDVVLRSVFKYLHPLDLIHGCSKVCQRWNFLIRAPSLYREVRVVVTSESFRNGSVRRFLEMVRTQVRKLCVVHSSSFMPLNELYTIFPVCMPNVVLLDLGSFDDLPRELIEKLVSCFPNVETLNIATVARSKAKQEQLSTLFVDAAFPRLRRLVIGYVDAMDMQTAHALLSWKRQLEVLVFRNAISPRLRHVETMPFSTTLKELHLELVRDVDIATIYNFKNLVTLSLGCCWQMRDEHLIHLKEQYKLEHLHFSTLGEGVSTVGLASFLHLPEHNAEYCFPHRLKYLRLSYSEQFNNEAVKELLKSCPDLESLNVAGDAALDDEALSLLIANLRKLRFLDISNVCNGERKLNALQDLAGDELPYLRLLQVHYNDQIAETTLQALNVRRPSMLISPRRDYLINWSIVEGRVVFSKHFKGDLNAVINDLNDEPGFCCIDDHSSLCGQG
ncbi:F-box/LRR-repeat protein 7 [Toxocara canis]|uniref:F-box/LRR-repeat protein 7 n=2 Tax=Toxocara canis TaxID=6265 RepID=A0A0B2V2G9_TOXCA|nr:F-box/LRR-repeat protein 7 [Toxocara canis]VDM39652.1 unnamed protein product [Toxocara canis]